MGRHIRQFAALEAPSVIEGPHGSNSGNTTHARNAAHKAPKRHQDNDDRSKPRIAIVVIWMLSSGWGWRRSELKRSSQKGGSFQRKAHRQTNYRSVAKSTECSFQMTGCRWFS